MFFSEKKLRELANLSDKIKTENIVDAINSIGFEVESLTQFNKNEDLKFGHVLDVEKNPNSERLTVCKIQFSDKIRTIQTTATNVKKDDYLVAFIPGSKINGLEIKAKEMANIVSEGMLASLPELGFNSNLLTKEMDDGILILDKEVDLSLDPIKYLGLDDNIIEVSILSNRSDAQSYEIFSKEIAAYFQTKPNKDLVKNVKETFKSNIEIESNDENKLNGVEVKNNGFKLQLEDIILLLKSNMKIDENDFVNFSNLATIFTGVSLRVFDLDKIKNKILIKKESEITYLNDSKNNISILGVEEIKDFRANADSKNIFFEFSQIDQKIVRDNSKLTKKTTNSSINNSRFISSGLIQVTRNFIAKYFLDISQLINWIDEEEKKIKFDKEYLNNYAGFDISIKPRYKDAIKSLEILGFKFSSDSVQIPNTRHDIKNMQNIVEEIFRFYGLNNFNPEAIEYKTFIVDPIDSIEKRISSLGYKQAWTYTLINKEKNIFNPFNFSNLKNLKTFVSEEFNSIRNSIALPLLNVFDYNQKRKIEKMSLFDLGMINDRKSIIIASNEKTYIQIKSDLEKISNQKFEIRKLNNEFLHPNYDAALYLGGQMVGWIGKFNPFFIDQDIIFGEILEDCLYIPKNKFTNFDASPLKERDITFEIEKDFENALYLDKINSINGIFSVNLISTFVKDDITKLTYRILMDDQALKEFEKINWENKEELLNL